MFDDDAYERLDAAVKAYHEARATTTSPHLTAGNETPRSSSVTPDMVQDTLRTLRDGIAAALASSSTAASRWAPGRCDELMTLTRRADLQLQALRKQRGSRQVETIGTLQDPVARMTLELKALQRLVNRHCVHYEIIGDHLAAQARFVQEFAADVAFLQTHMPGLDFYQLLSKHDGT